MTRLPTTYDADGDLIGYRPSDGGGGTGIAQVCALAGATVFIPGVGYVEALLINTPCAFYGLYEAFK